MATRAFPVLPLTRRGSRTCGFILRRAFPALLNQPLPLQKIDIGKEISINLRTPNPLDMNSPCHK